MSTARRRGTPPTATAVDPATANGGSWRSWWSAAPLAAAALAALGLIFGSPRVEDRIGAAAAADMARIVLLVVVVVWVAHEVGRALAARRPGHPTPPVTDGESAFDLVAVVSHELRTPLTSMLGLMSTVQRGAGRLPPDRLADLAGMACEQGWRLERLVEDLQGPRDGTDLRPERRDAVATVRDAVATLPVADHHVVLALPDEPVLRCLDHEVVIRMVTNLVGNALKYTPGGSRITVAARPLPGGLELSVTDDGPGMSFADRSKAFDKYWRGVTGGKKGLGLGLYLVRALAAAHGGAVTLEDAPAGGCRFVVRVKELGAAAPAPALAR